VTNNLKLFSKQNKIYPKRTWGKFRKIKWGVMVVTLTIYYLSPWIRWNRGPNAPDQAILIDMPNRRAYFFFIDIWPQEIYFLVGLLILAALSLFLFTSLFGRVWCGYACPQTVWTDLFVWVERIVQGDRNKRIKLDKYPYEINTLWRKGITHFIWIIIALLTGGAWVFYFNDAPTILENIINVDLPWRVSSWILALTFSTYLMAGFAREQVCTYMCPYARFQSAMFDKDSLIIKYDESRGEPRAKHKLGDSWDGKGHCIDCTACIQVCPIGIDIRNGLQMECIACGLCADECNRIMNKIGLPSGLIRYDTESRNLNPNLQFNFFRPRTVFYTLIIFFVGITITVGLIIRPSLELHVIHHRNPLFVKLSDGTIRNGYDIKILNKTYEDKVFTLVASGIPNTKIEIIGYGNVKEDEISVLSNSVNHLRIFAYAPFKNIKRQKITFVLQEHNSSLIDTTESIFISQENL